MAKPKTNSCYSALVQSLRNSMNLYQQTLIVHWGLMGGKFFSIHKLTEMIYEEMQEGIDTIAEHIRSLDIATPMNTADLNYSDMPELKSDSCFCQDKMIQHLASNNTLLAEKFQEIAKAAEAVGDQLTLDLAVERGRAHKKFQWLLKSCLDYS